MTPCSVTVKGGTHGAMPIEVVTEAKVVETAPTDGFENLSERIYKNLAKLSYIRARKKPRVGRPGPLLACVVHFKVETTDDAGALIEKAVEAIHEAISRDADGNDWRGEVQLYGEDNKTFESVDVHIGADSVPEKPTKDGEVVGILSTLRLYLGDMAKANGDLAKSLANIGVAFKDVIQSVANANGDEAKARYEYEWKMQESRERMHEHEVDAEASVHNRTATKFMFGGLLEKYQPIFDTLARRYAAQGGVKTGKAKAMPPRPTEQEVLSVFPLPTDETEDAYADIRSVALAMLRERDPIERSGLQQKMVVELSRLGGQILIMQAEAERVLGVERTAQVIGWYRAPWD